MSFEEWMEGVKRVPGSKLDLLLKLVRAQDKIIEKLITKLAEERSVIVLGPNARKLMNEIEDLQAALMEKSDE